MRPGHVDVYGGTAAVAEQVLVAARDAAHDGPGAPRAVAIDPAAGRTVSGLDVIRITFDRPVVASRSTVHVTVDGRELPGRSAADGTTGLVFRPAGDGSLPDAGVHDVVVTIAAAGRDGALGHLAASLTYHPTDRLFAVAGPVELRLPSEGVELVGYHESNHDGAQAQTVRDGPVPVLTMPSRDRGTPRTSAADVVADPARQILAPVSGTVVRAGSYVLYCRYTDDYAVIAPDARPDWEVKVLHFTGVRVAAGDRVEAGRTVLGTAPRTLAFRSQVDRYSAGRDWPHVHLEVVDPSVPDRPGPGC
jgi:biotin carboxyl carrier protein